MLLSPLQEVVAQVPQPPTNVAVENGAVPTVPELRSRLKTVEESAALEEELRTNLLNLYNEAIADRVAAEQAEQATATLESSAKSVEQRIAALKSAAPAAPAGAGFSESSALSELTTAKQQREDELVSLRKQLSDLQETIRARREEAKRLPQEEADLKAEITRLTTPITPPEDANQELIAAAETARNVDLLRARAQLALNQQKQRTYDAEAELLPQQGDYLERRIAEVENQLSRVSALLSDQRKQQVRQRIERLSELIGVLGLEDLHLSSGLREADEGLMEIVGRWPALIDKTRAMESRLIQYGDQLAKLEDDLEKTRLLIESNLQTGQGLSRSIGLMILRKNSRLASGEDWSLLQAQLQEEFEEVQGTLTTVDAWLEQLPASRGSTTTEDGRAVGEVREILQAFAFDADRLLQDVMFPMNTRLEQLQTTKSAFQELIDQHLLWVRSESTLEPGDLFALGPAGLWFFQWEHWRALLTATQAILRDYTIVVVTWGVILIVLLASRPMFVRKLEPEGTATAKRLALEMRPTWNVMVASVMLALPLPVLVGIPGQLFLVQTATDGFVTAFGRALVLLAAVALPLELLRQLMRRGGAAETQFGWPEASSARMRWAIRRFEFFLLPLMFVWRILQTYGATTSDLTVAARILFVAMMVIVSTLIWRLLKAPQGLISTLLVRNPDGWFARLRLLWQALLIGIPLGLAALSVAGYAYSSLQLSLRLYESVWLLILVAISYGLAVRWLTIARRQLLLQQLRAKNAAKEQAQTVAEGVTADMINDQLADVTSINQQTRRLIDATAFVGILAGIYWIWSPVLPALGIFDRVTLWENRAADGTVLDTVTLTNVLISLPIVILTFIIVRNAPGLMETALLQRLPLEKAVRYAITTLASYLLAAIGLILAAGTLGLHWDSIQWVVAGLGVGLGFGLQEIFANFISGVILLFEQPIRVGDVVTLDGTTGVVSRIRMRATTITNWDRQELVVPNKDFITGRLVNWTLTDTTNRVVVTVGIAYGSNTQEACQILQQICDDHADVLTEPAPLISFEGFGDSALTVVLRFYLASLDRRLQVIHEVHTAIHDRFNAAGIELAFPQRDIHIRSIDDARLLDRLVKPQPVGEAEAT